MVEVLTKDLHLLQLVEAKEKDPVWGGFFYILLSKLDDIKWS